MSTEGKRWMLLDQPAQMLEVAPDDDEAFYGPFYVLASEYDRLRAALGRIAYENSPAGLEQWEVMGIFRDIARAALAGEGGSRD